MPVRLAQHLVQKGLLAPDKVEEAVRRQAVSGGALDTVLLEQGVIAEQGMLQALGDVSGLRPVNLADFEPNHEVAGLVPHGVAERIGVVPLSVDGGTLHLASVYPPATNEIAEVGVLLGKQVELWVAIEARVRDWISAIYKQPLPTRFAVVLAALDPNRPLPASALLKPKAAAEKPKPSEKPPAAAARKKLDEGSTLEESLTRDMVEQLARNVVDEPIPLAVKKPAVPPRPEPTPEPDSSPRLPVARAPATDFEPEEKTDPAMPVVRPPSDYEETVVRPAYEPSSRPDWDRHETKALSPETYAQFVKESAVAREQGIVAPVPAELPKTPAIEPVVSPPRAETASEFRAVEPPRAKTASEFQAVQPPPPPAQVTTEVRAAPPPPLPIPEPPPAPPPQDEPPGVSAELDFSGVQEDQSPSWAAQAEPVSGAQAPAQVSWSESGVEVAVDFGAPPESAPPQGMVVFSEQQPEWAQSSGELPMPAVDRRVELQHPEPAWEQPAEEVTSWTLEQARELLRQGSSDREYLIDVVLRFARQSFDFACAFAVVRGTAVGWDARGFGVDRSVLYQLSIPLDAQSVFRTVAMTRGSFVGPLPNDQLTHHFIGLLGRAPRTAFLFPVEVKGRLVAILYGDCGPRPMSQRRLSEFILFCQDVSGAFQELILYRKRYLAEQWAAQAAQPTPEEGAPEGYPQQYEPAPDEAPPPGEEPVIAPPEPPESAEPPGLTALAPMLTTTDEEPARQAGMGWGGWSAGTRGSIGGRSASMPVFATIEGERPPPDFAPVIGRLTGPDAADRARAMAELQRTPDASAKVLARYFPGPTAWSKLPVEELPDADELGPIPGAMSRLGRAGAQALAPLLDSDDPDTRYLALLTAGNLAYPELVGGILRGLFDYEPDVSSAARAAASALKKLPRFDAAIKDLRKELAARDPLRRSLSARALGVLHDRESIEGLINLTRSDDQMCAQAAAEALREITRANFGTQTRQWLAWWAENRDKRRVEWLVEALRSRDMELRQAAVEELARAVNDTLGYAADASEEEREPAVRRWEDLISQSERGRRFEL